MEQLTNYVEKVNASYAKRGQDGYYWTLGIQYFWVELNIKHK